MDDLSCADKNRFTASLPGAVQPSTPTVNATLPRQTHLTAKHAKGINNLQDAKASPIVHLALTRSVSERRSRAIRVNNDRRLFCVRSNHRRGRGGTKAQRKCLIGRMVIDWNRWTNLLFAPLRLCALCDFPASEGERAGHERHESGSKRPENPRHALTSQ